MLWECITVGGGPVLSSFWLWEPDSCYWITVGTGLPDSSHVHSEHRERAVPVPASALELEVSLQVPPPSCWAVQEAEPSTPPMLLPRLSAWGTDSSISHLLPALGIPCVSP